jgi:hypothetical protein
LTDAQYEHIVPIQKYCHDHAVPKDVEKKVVAEEEKRNKELNEHLNKAIKANHGKNTQLTETQKTNAMEEAEKNIKYELIVPDCCYNVNRNMSYIEGEKNREKVKAYFKKAHTEHKESLVKHIKGKGNVGKK